MDSCGFNRNNISTTKKGEIPVIDNGNISNISSRLKEAANIAMRELNTIRDVPSTIEILNQKNTSIVIDEITDHDDPTKKYIVVHGGGKSVIEPLFRDEVGKLRYIYLRNLHECRIFVKCKLLRVMFHKCNKCHISLRAPVVGMVEFFHCELTNINIRIPNGGEIPVTRIESCTDLHIFQSNDCLVYLIYMSVDINGTIVEQQSGARLTDYELGSLFWEDQCQVFICLSRDDGFAASPMEYVLNDLSHHIIVKSPREDSSPLEEDSSLDSSSLESSSGVQIPRDSREELFGTTPPVNNSEGAWEKYLEERRK